MESFRWMFVDILWPGAMFGGGAIKQSINLDRPVVYEVLFIAQTLINFMSHSGTDTTTIFDSISLLFCAIFIFYFYFLKVN